MSATPREERGSGRVYKGERIEIHWEPRLCIHTQSCVERLGAVFDAQRRPWIDPGGAEPDEIAETVLTCPTGALHFRRLDGGPDEEPPDPPTVVPRENGPLFLRGRIRIEDPEGNVIREDTRVALCRCGGSANKPFCDGTHRRNGFTTD